MKSTEVIKIPVDSFVVFSARQKIEKLIEMMPPASGDKIMFYMKRNQTLFFKNEKGERFRFLLSHEIYNDFKVKRGEVFLIKPTQTPTAQLEKANILVLKPDIHPLFIP